VGWEDPSPRARPRSPGGSPAAQPGYGSEAVSFGRLLFRGLIAGALGIVACVAARSVVMSWRGHADHATGLDIGIALAIGLVVALLAWRYVASHPPARGLSARVRDGRGWGSSGRYADSGFYVDASDIPLAVDGVGSLVEAVADVAGDVFSDT
jgi:hypothetical protein